MEFQIGEAFCTDFVKHENIAVNKLKLSNGTIIYKKINPHKHCA